MGVVPSVGSRTNRSGKMVKRNDLVMGYIIVRVSCVRVTALACVCGQ